MTHFAKAAEARAAGVASQAARPQQRRHSETSGSGTVLVALRSQEIRSVTRDGLSGVVVGGLASVTETPYEMYDAFGPYNEVVTRGAFLATLTTNPLVEFTVNHGAGGGLPMAHTRNGTLTLTEGDSGLEWEAFVDPSRSDVANMLKAMERGDLAEASFKFRIDSGKWSPDYSEYRIDSVNLNRGDVSAVNFGANPHATSGLRSAMALDIEARVQRALTDPERTNLAVILGALNAADDALDDVLESLSALLGIPNVDECECDCAACADCTGGMSSDAAAAPAALGHFDPLMLPRSITY